MGNVDEPSIAHQYAAVQRNNEPTTPSIPFAKRGAKVDFTCASVFQLELNNVLGKYRVPLQLHDDIVQLLQKHSPDGKELDFHPRDLKQREPFVDNLAATLHMSTMRPKDVTVELPSGGKATVSVFDPSAVIQSLLNDESLWKEHSQRVRCIFW